MKNRVFILSFLISMISVNLVFAQTSTKKLSYQAVVRNAANELVVNQNLAVEITVLDAENAPQYKETHPSVPTNQNGLLWLWVGEGSPTLGTMADVVWKDAVIRSVFTLPDGSTVTQNTPVTAMPYAYFADEVDTIFLQNYLDTHDVVPDNYVTHPQLNDTLDHYYTKGNVDNKLNDYEKKSELCGDVKECIKDTLGKYTTSNQIDTLLGAYYDTTHTKSVISDTATALRAMMGDAAYNSKITLKKNNVELDSFRLNQQTDKAINIPIPTTVAELSDAANYTTNAQLNDTLSHYFDTTQVKTAIHDTAVAIRAAIPAQVNADWNATSGKAEILNKPTIPTTVAELSDAANYATNAHLNDTLSHYYNDVKVNDTLSYYYNTTQVKTAIHDTANAIRAAIPAQVNADWSATSGAAEILNKPDLSVYATNAHLNDTLNSFATKDTLSAYATKDTLKNFLTISGLCDSLVKCGVIKDMRDSIRDNAAAIQINATNIQTNATNIGLNKQAIIDSSAHIRNDIKNGQITIAVNRSTATTETTVTNPTFGVNQRTDQTVTINIPQETTVNNGQLTIVAAGDTTRFTANQATNDTVRLNKFATKEALKDTAKTLRGIICDSATACITKALADPTSEINYAIDTIARHHVSDSTRMVFDTLHKYYATKDTLKNFVNKLAIRDSVNNIVKDSLAAPNSAINLAIDTIARHNISDSTRMVFDTLHKYYATKDTLKNFVNKLAIRDSVNNIMKDSLAAPNSAINHAIDTIARHNISDSTRMVFDTLHYYYTTNAHLNDTLKHYTTSKQIDTLLGAYATKVALRDSTKMVRDTLHKYYATKDTLRNFVRNDALCAEVMNCIDIKHMRDSIQKVNTRLTLDSTKLQANIDTVSSHIRAIIPTVSNATVAITVNSNATPAGSFKLNQSEGTTIDLQNIAVTNAPNTYTAANDFTGSGASITVPSNETAIPRPTPMTVDCNNNYNAVNVCDLLAVFDSLSRRIDSLAKELAAIKNAAPPVYNNDLSFSNVTTTTMTVTASFTSPGFNITSYTLCYSTHENMSDSLVVTSNSPEFALTNLAPYTTYYVTMSATNVIGTTTSPKASKLTRSNAPTANVTGITTTPSGITVTLNNLDFKEPVEGTVEIYYKKKTEASCGTNLADYPVHVTSETISNTTTSTYSRFISTPESETPYCVIVKLINADTTTILAPIEVTSGTMDEFEIKSDYEGYYGFPITSFWPCKTDNTITVQFVAVPKVNSIDNYANYTFNWSFEPVPHQSGECCQDLPIYEILKNNKDTFQVKFTSYESSLAAMRVICTATNAQTSEGITGSVVHRVRQYKQNNSVYRPTISEIINGKTVQINSSLYDLIYWGDGTDTLNTDTLDTSDPASGRHDYSEPGDYTIWVLKKTIQSGGDNYFVCDASKTITVVEPPANKYKCHVSTPHQGTGYENNGYNNGSGPANDGYEETDANDDIISVTDYDGNSYPVVQIGSQCWIAKNMRCEHSPITGSYIVKNYPGDTYYKTCASKSAHWLHNDPSYASSDTGLLYNFCAAADVYNGTELNTLNQNSWTPTINTPYHRGICPKGWHLPTYDDWNTLRNNENANTAAKVAGDGWPSPSGGCGDTNPCSESLNHNVSGFSALLTCYMNYNGWNTLRTDGTGFWASTCSSGKASGSVLTTGSGSLSLSNNYYQFNNLFSVRCIRDAETGN